MRVEVITQEVIPPDCLSDTSFPGLNLLSLSEKHLVDLPDNSPDLSPCLCKDHKAIHIPLVKDINLQLSGERYTAPSNGENDPLEVNPTPDREISGMVRY